MVKPDGNPLDRRAGQRVDVIKGEEVIEGGRGRHMDQTVGVKGRVLLESVPHRCFHIRIPPGNQSQDEMSAGCSRDLGPNPVELVGIMGAKIGLRLTVREKSEGSRRGAPGSHQKTCK